MKNCFLTLVLIFLTFTANADNFIFKGKVKQWAGDTLTVNRNGHPAKEAAKVAVDAEGNFNCTFDLDEPTLGYYHTPGVFRTIIMIPGTTTEVGSNGTGVADVEFVGEMADIYAFNDKERKKMSQMLNRLVPEDEGREYSFACVHSAITAYMDSVFSAVKTIPNETFQKLFIESVSNSCEYTLINYGDGLKDQSSDPDYNSYMSKLNLHSTFNVGRYLRWREACEGRGRGNLNYLNMLDIIGKADMAEDIREKSAIEVVESYFSRTDSLIDKVVENALVYIKNEKYREAILKAHEIAKQLVPGAKLKECELEAPDGSKHQFSELQGKYVFMDIWATWCVPCCAQIPHMEKLYEHYKDDPRIEIVSISIDSKAQPWLDKLQKDQPKWRQFLQPKFTKMYAIPGIPRFFFIAPDGTFVDSSAPRPSSENIIEWIEERMRL